MLNEALNSAEKKEDLEDTFVISFTGTPAKVGGAEGTSALLTKPNGSQQKVSVFRSDENLYFTVDGPETLNMNDAIELFWENT